MSAEHQRTKNAPGQGGAGRSPAGQGPGVVPVLDPVTLDPAEVEIDANREVEARAHPPSPARPRGTIRAGRLAGLSMRAAIWTVAWPVLCESLLNSTVGLVDTAIASGVSQQATDAVAAAAYLLWFVGLVSTAIGTGATALIARSVGAGRLAVARGALGQAVVLALIGGTLVGLVFVLTAPSLARLFSLRADAAELFVTYMRAMSLGMPLACVLFAGMACARGAGDTLRPLITMLIVNVVNLAVSYTLAVVLKWGVLGIGLGTSLAWSVGGVLITFLHLRGGSAVRLRARWLRPHRVTVYRLVRLGLPNFFETLGMYAVNLGVVVMVGSMGAAAVLDHASSAVGESGGLLGAHLWAIRIEAFSFLPGFSMGIAAGALCGQYLGAGAPEQARRAAIICAQVAMVMMGTLGLVFIFGGGPIMRLLSSQPAHRLITPQLLAITGFVQVPFAIAVVLRSAMHGAGDVRAVMIMTWICQWGLRLPLAYAISGVDIALPQWLGGGVLTNPFPFRLGLRGLWIGLCTEIVVRSAIYGGRFLHGGWMKARV